MAKIVEEIVAIRVSRVVKDNAGDSDKVFTSDVCGQIESVLEEMLGSGGVVEIISDF